MKPPTYGAAPLRALGLLAAFSLGPAAAVGQGLVLEAELVANGLTRPIAVVAPDDGTGRLLVAEQTGAIRIVRDGAVESQPFLDLSSEIACCGELGLLGLALHPDFAANGSFYVAYTEAAANPASAHDLLVVRFAVSADPDVADAASGLQLLRVMQPFSNHNGGHLAFGPDGYLYIGLGDGGGGGDPGDNGQNPMTLLGSMLRLDVSGDDYTIPPDNPFAQDGAGRPEVFAWGLRNPWRYSFDPATGDLWIGDVGQDRLEEISVARAATGGGNGANFGWNEMEGDEPYRDGTTPDGHVGPVATYGRSGGRCSVTGGVVYRGAAIPALSGAYVFGDFCSGELFAVDAAAPDQVTVLDVRVPQLTSFGVDRAGELYALSRNGGVFRIVAA